MELSAFKFSDWAMNYGELLFQANGPWRTIATFVNSGTGGWMLNVQNRGFRNLSSPSERT
jgi:hypothetical protein